jgi:hypothetical protein
VWNLDGNFREQRTQDFGRPPNNLSCGFDEWTLRWSGTLWSRSTLGSFGGGSGALLPRHICLAGWRFFKPPTTTRKAEIGQGNGAADAIGSDSRLKMEFEEKRKRPGGREMERCTLRNLREARGHRALIKTPAFSRKRGALGPSTMRREHVCHGDGKSCSSY